MALPLDREGMLQRLEMRNLGEKEVHGEPRKPTVEFIFS